MPLLHLQPMHPAHGLEHPLHRLWAGRHGPVQPIGVGVTLGHLEGQRHPWVEVAARSDPGQLVRSLGRLGKAGCHVVDCPFDRGVSHGACPHHRRGVRPVCARIASPPSPAGRLELEDKDKLRSHPANAVIEIQGMASGEKVDDLIQPVRMIGIDPNLYEVKTIFDDVQLVVGAQEANFGGLAKATATETSIAESARMSALGAQIDELDSFMSEVTRAAGQILLTEMSAEQVKSIVGPGAVWPELTNEQIQEEIFLEIEAGSTGKPNQAAEMRNMERMLPFILQVPGIDPKWVAREVIKRLDDRLDVDEAMSEAIPSIVAMNAAKNAQAAAGGMPGAQDPAMQGAQGAVNAPSAPGVGGSLPPMGNNQT